MTPEEIAAADAAQAAADAAKAQATAEATAAPKTYDEAYVKSLRTEAQTYRTKLKEFTDAEEARKLAELSEVDRLKAVLAETEKRAKALEIDTIRTKAAAKHSLPEDLMEFVTAEDEAGALAQAQKLAEKLKPATTLPNSGERNPAGGTANAQKAVSEDTLKQLKTRIPALNGRVLRS